jgi:hypothetical protein
MKYLAYNLIIESELPLPLPVDDSGTPADIVITIGKIDEPENLCRTYDGVWYVHGEDSLFLKWDIIGSFLIQQGQKITFFPSPLPQVVSPVVPLLGTVMAVALHQRGLAALHGSSVLLEGTAVVFLGEKGEGKSTMAAFFQKQGKTILSDDVCAIDFKGKQRPFIYPSFSKIKLWPDSMQYFDYAPEKHDKVHPGCEKRNISLDRGFSNVPALLDTIVVLTTGNAIFIKPLIGHKAIPVLIPHLILNRFPNNQPEILLKSVYDHLGSLLKKVRILQLTRPRDLTLLPKLTKIVKCSL